MNCNNLEIKMNNQAEQIFLLTSSENQPSNSAEKMNEISAMTPVNLENVEDFSNVCRTCATITEFVIPIFSGEGLQNNLAEKINKYLPIQVCPADTLPRVVCCQCAGTLLACHELAQCCRHADRALRTRLAARASASASAPAAPLDQNVKSLNNDEDQNEDKEQQQESKWKPCRESFESAQGKSGLAVTFNGDRHRGESSERNIYDEIDIENDHHLVSEDDDDEPLSVVASKKTNFYNDFYTALMNFRNHFVKDHKSGKCSYPDFTDSSDSEMVEEDNTSSPNLDSFDDLTQCNMRKDRMDEETRSELNQVQTRIDGRTYYTCKVCGKNLSSSHTYVFHKRIHTGERPCVCHVCGKQFRAPNGLQRHLTETHERRRRHACCFCAKSFANSQNLKQHLRIHTGEKPFVCAHCGKRFTQSGSLHVHLRRHTEHFPFTCSECGAKFRLRTGLARHTLKHSGERPHVCVYCGKCFLHKYDLKNHVQLHSDTKPHICTVCGAAFKQKRAMKHHVKRVHESVDTSREVTHPLVYSHAEHF